MSKSRLEFQELVKINTNPLWIPKYEEEFPKEEIRNPKPVKLKKDKLRYASVCEKAKIIEFFPTEKQKMIIWNWLEACTRMYNVTRNVLKKLASEKLKYEALSCSQMKKLDEAKLNFENGTSSREEIRDLKKSYKFFFNKLKKVNEELNLCLDWEYMRSKVLMEEKGNIREYSHLSLNEKKALMRLDNDEEFDQKMLSYKPREENKIPSHSLDGAIKFAVANYLTALKNLETGHIKTTSLRNLSFQRRNWTMEMEKQYVESKDTMFHRILGKMTLKYNNKPYEQEKINRTFTIKYDMKTNKFFFHMSEKLRAMKGEHNNSITVIDPGVRGPLNCMTENSAFKLGEKISSDIYDRIGKVSEMNKNEKIPNKVKKKWRHRFKIKTQNQVDNFHWESANLLAKTSRTVIIGDMDSKSIISSKNNTISKTTKYVLNKLRFRTFLERLRYKCKTFRTNFLLVREHYTSKTCSECSYYDEKLGGNKIFVCRDMKCQMMLIDRDFNSCRNIYLKSKIPKYISRRD